MKLARIRAAASRGTKSQSTSPARDLVGVGLGMIDDHAEVAEHLGHERHVGDLGHVGEAAALAGQRGCGEQLEGGVLGAADGHLATQRLTTLDADGLLRDGRRLVLPVERPSRCHG